MHIWLDEHKKFLADNIKGTYTKQLTEMFNKRFNVNLKNSQITAAIKKLGLKSGLDCGFRKGCTPFNKGTKGLMKPNKTSFRKGNKPHNYKKIGEERITGDGYIEIKIKEPNKWRGKHILIWEKHNGKVPKSHAIIFADGDKRNFKIENLLLVSRSELLIMNKHNLIKDTTELTKAGALIAKLQIKISGKKEANYEFKRINRQISIK